MTGGPTIDRAALGPYYSHVESSGRRRKSQAGFGLPVLRLDSVRSDLP